MVEPTNNTLCCYHFDATGHTVALTDISKAIVNKYAYSPFGTLANQEETVAQPFKFVGQYGVMNEENGWYYMRARYYDPNVGRFISEDPLGFDGGDVNLYVYASNNPVMFVDPNGMDPFAGMKKFMAVPAFEKEMNAYYNIAENSMNNVEIGMDIGILAAQYGVDYAVNSLFNLEIMMVNPEFFKKINPFNVKKAEAKEAQSINGQTYGKKY